MGYSEYRITTFVISRLFIVCFSNGFQQNDGNTLLNIQSYVITGSNIFFSFLHGENHYLSLAFLAYISVSSFKKNMRANVPTMHIIIVHLQVYSGRFEYAGKFLSFKNYFTHKIL